MRPLPRPPFIRKTIKYGKYGGAALTVLLAAVWIGSGWTSVYWRAPQGVYVFLVQGGLRAGMPVVAEPGATFLDTHFDQWELNWKGGIRSTSWGRHIELPLWVPIVGPLVVTSLAWRADTRARRRDLQDKCPKCHYDRTGLLPDAVCPECGTAAASA